MTGAAAGPILLCVVAALGLWLATGVRLVEVVGFLAYQAAFVLGPGWVVVRIVRRGDGPLTSIALGWALGYVLELVAFALTATVGVRWLFFLYPVLVGGLGLLAWRSRSGPAPASPGPDRRTAWATAAVTVIAMALIALSTLAANPLPRSVPNVVLYNDLVFDISLAADASARWPLTDPNVAGEPLRYHVLAFWDAAAAHRVTGIELDVLVLRLQPLMRVVIAAFLLAWLCARTVRGSPWVAPGAVAIMFLAGELDLDSDRPAPFVGLFTGDLILSPTFAFGLVFFTAATGLVLEILRSSRWPSRGTWVILAALFAGAMGAKASAMAVLLGALGLVTVGLLVLERRIDRRAATALGVGVGAFVLVYALLFAGGGGTEGSVLQAFAFRQSGVLAGSFSGSLISVVATAAVTVGLFAPWLGTLLLVRLDRDERLAVLWLGALVVTAMAPFILLSQTGLAQIYFLHYAGPPAALLSAWGISRAWPTLRASRRPVLVVLVVVALGVGTALFIDSRTPGTEASTPGQYLVPYLALAVVGLALALAVERRLRQAIALAVTGVVLLAVADVPLDVGDSLEARESSGAPAYVADQRPGPRGIDPKLLAGLRWLRDHSDPDDVVATSTEDVTDGDSRFFYVAAYAERRTFLGGADFTSTAFRHKNASAPGCRSPSGVP